MSEKEIDRAYAKPIFVDGNTIPAGTKIALSPKRAANAKKLVGLFEEPVSTKEAAKPVKKPETDATT